MATTLVEWRAKADRLAKAAKSAREASKEIGERTMGAVATVGAGYAVGVVVRKYGDKPIPGTDVPLIPAIGAIAAIAGVAGAAGNMSAFAASLGSGALGGYAAIKGFQG